MTKSAKMILWLWAITFVMALGFILNQVSVESDLAQFMPQGRNLEQRLLLNEIQQGPASRLMLAAIENDNSKALAKTSRALAKELRKLDGVLRVSNGNALLNKPIRRLVSRYRYLLSDEMTTDHFSAAHLRTVLEQRLSELNSPLAMVNNRFGALTTDPTAQTRAVFANWRPEYEPTKQHGVWFSTNKKRALLLVEATAEDRALDEQEAFIKRIRQSFQNVAAETSQRLLLSGPAVFAVESREIIRSEAKWLSIIASIGVILILAAAFRSPRLILLSAIPLVSAMTAATVVVAALFGAIHGITLAFGITLLGVAIDYPIHLFSHLSHKQHVMHSVKTIWPTVRLGVITTALAYLAMAMTDVAGLAQLGVFTLTGIVVAALVTRWVLPGFMPQTWRRDMPTLPAERLRWLLAPGRTVALIAGLCGFAAIFFLWQLPNKIWESDIATLSPVPKESIELDRNLRRQLGAPDVNYLLIVTSNSAEGALQKSEHLETELQSLISNQQLQSFDAPSRYLPSQHTQRARQNALPGAATLQQNLEHALHKLPFQEKAFAPFITSVNAAHDLPPLSPEDVSDTLLADKLASLLIQRNGQWLALLPLAGVSNPSALAQRFAEQDDSNVQYFSLSESTNALLADFRGETLQRIAWASGLILLILAWGLRSPQRILAAAMPVALSIAVTLSLLLGMGQQLSLFHLVALLLTFGISIDYALFFSRCDDDPATRLRTFRGLLICAVSTVTVFAILAGSQVPVLQAIGLTVAIGVSSAFGLGFALTQQIPLWLTGPAGANKKRLK